MKRFWSGLMILIMVIAAGNSLVVLADGDVMGIADAQRILNKIGYECGAVDGIKGSRTLSAIELFQRIHDIPEDGVISEDTKQDLLRAEKEKAVISYLIKAIPELQDVVSTHKNTDLIFYAQGFPNPAEHDRYYRDYYSVYIGFHVMEHRTRMATFLVGKKLDEVLWDNPATGKFVSVEEWRKSKNGSTTSSANNSVANDWLCIPFKRVGPITLATNADELIRLFGADNVRRRTIPGAEGSEYFDVSVIYPDMPNEVIVYWQGNSYGVQPQSVSVQHPGTAWKTVGGITVGTSLEELNRINGQPFTISGFGWDYGGYVSSWGGGTLGSVKGLIMRLRPTRNLSPEFYGDGVKINSGDPRMLPDAVEVGDFSITLTASE